VLDFEKQIRVFPNPLFFENKNKIPGSIMEIAGPIRHNHNAVYNSI
jgi:hypothetical protein